jgi:precorrin-2/cobalt-factor-2 C20-methyltransferase
MNAGAVDGGVKGKLYGVGVGPGDPGLLTIRGAEALKNVEVICAPVSGPGGESMALRVVERNGLLKGKKVLRLVFPMTRDRHALREGRRKAAAAVMKEIERGRNVAFVTLGDPGLYSTFAYLLEELKDAVDVETIPGVTSISACLAACNTSLARGEEGIAVLPAHEAEGRLRNLLRSFDSVVLLKAKRVERIIEELRELGALENARVFAKCGDEDFRVLPLSALDEEREYFSMILVRGLK